MSELQGVAEWTAIHILSILRYFGKLTTFNILAKFAKQYANVGIEYMDIFG